MYPHDNLPRAINAELWRLDMHYLVVEKGPITMERLQVRKDRDGTMMSRQERVEGNGTVEFTPPFYVAPCGFTVEVIEKATGKLRFRPFGCDEDKHPRRRSWWDCWWYCWFVWIFKPISSVIRFVFFSFHHRPPVVGRKQFLYATVHLW